MRHGRTGQPMGGNPNGNGQGSGALGHGAGGVRPVEKTRPPSRTSKIKGLWQNGRMIGEYFDDSQQVKGGEPKGIDGCRYRRAAGGSQDHRRAQTSPPV